MDANEPVKQAAFPPGGRTKPAGLKEIAAYLNLSPATVSMVVNNVPLAKSLSEETRTRVAAAAKLFNYRPNLVARALSKRETRTIGVIAPESSDGYFTRVMRGIERVMLEKGYLYFTTSHLGREDLMREYPNALVQRGVDGLIFVNTKIYEHPNVPAVSISDACPVEGVTSVLVDQREGMYRAMEHLAQLGHRRILLMCGSEWSRDANDRYGAMMAAAKSLGLPVGPELTLDLETNQLTPEIPYRAVLEVLRRPRDFTAIFAFNDISAIGAVRAIEDHGLRCPQDISVLGIDDISTAAYLSPRLSTSAQPLEDMGAAAAEQLFARIQRPSEPQPAQVVFPMTLLVRESTGLAKAKVPRKGDSARSVAEALLAPSPSAGVALGS